MDPLSAMFSTRRNLTPDEVYGRPSVVGVVPFVIRSLCSPNLTTSHPAGTVPTPGTLRHSLCQPGTP